MFLVLLLYVLMASTFVIAKAAVLYAQPIFLIGVRMVLSGLLLLGYILLFARKQWRLEKKDWFLFAQIALFHIYVSFVLEFWCYKYVTASKISFMYNLSPFITALFAYICFRERMSTRKWIGLIVGFIGSLPILLGTAPTAELQAGSFYRLSFPEIALLVSATSAVYGWIVMKKLVVNCHYSPIMVNGVGMLFGGLAALMTSFSFEETPWLKCPQFATNHSSAIEELHRHWFCFSWPDFLMFILFVSLLILIANVIFYNFYGILLKKYTPTFLSLVGLLSPVFTAFLGWIFLGETVTWHFFISLALVSFGAYIFYQDELLEQGSVDEEIS